LAIKTSTLSYSVKIESDGFGLGIESREELENEGDEYYFNE
jgi:hypothetical protein